jgi:DnaD/phage-associated family protein
MGKPALTTEDVKNLTALVTQYALSTDYIATLAAYLASKYKLTAVRLRDRAISLVGKGIDNTEALEVYIKDREKQSSSELEFRRLLGIYNRTTTEAERRAFNKWSDEFGYSTAVVGEAYSICVMNTGSLSVPYMDKVLTVWHEAGCKTVEECRALVASEKAKADKEKTEAPTPRKRSKTEPEKPRYGDFDINDAFKAALERSYE